MYLCNYQNIYGSVYGLNLWEQASSKKQLDSYVKEMTISELAAELKLSSDTIRNRINEMQVNGRGVRVAGWHVLDTTMVRVWGMGTEPDEPKPVRVRVAAIRKRRKDEGEHQRISVPDRAPPVVRFRREGMDEWLFRIQELR